MVRRMGNKRKLKTNALRWGKKEQPMKNKILLVMLCCLAMVVTANASPRIKALYVFPYETTQIGDLQEPVCQAEVLEADCRMEGDTVPSAHSYTPSYNLYIPSIDAYVPSSFTQAACENGILTQGTCIQGSLNPVTRSMEVEYEGSIPFTYATFELTGCIPNMVGALACPEDRWTDYVDGKCPCSNDYPPFAVRCEEKKSGHYPNYVYTHRFFLENRDNCCKEDGQSGNWTCFGVDPTEVGDPECIPTYEFGTVTLPAFYSDSKVVDYTDHELLAGSSTLATVGAPVFVGATCSENPITQAVANGVNFTQAVANGVNFTPAEGGGIVFTQALYTPSEHSYTASSDEYVAGSCGQAYHTEATATINCPEITDPTVPVRNVELEQLVTKTCVGTTVNVRGSGYAYPKRGIVGEPKQIIKSRFQVFYAKPGKATNKRIYKEERELVDLVDITDEGGEFKEEREWTFELPGTYTFKYAVFNKGERVDWERARTVEVLEGCEPEILAATE
jgi:hypothetical protein